MAYSSQSFLSSALNIVGKIHEIHNKDFFHGNINSETVIVDPITGRAEIKQHEHDIDLHYISPEQTGRMNQTINYRTDFYSLGILFYKMLTDRLPFSHLDYMELIHAHLAVLPSAPKQINPEIPLILSDLTMKLIDKNADNRYQSTTGLLHDLNLCIKTLRNQEANHSFVLGQKDFSEKLQIPRKLYGRNPELKVLMDTFQKTLHGSVEVLLVSGYSGVGKSAFVHEVYKIIVKHNGYCIEGKFDQFQRNIPYSAIIQMFRTLVKQLFTETDERMTIWKANIQEAIQVNAQIIVDLIPEVEKIIGKQKPVQELGPVETQNRFLDTFRNFIKVFAKKEHPLVLFLDDLQWVDTPTLNLIKHLIDSNEMEYFLLVGSFRSNEVDGQHQLQVAIRHIEKSTPIHQVSLCPLERKHVNQLVAETLHQSEEQTGELSNLIFNKTQGNPFFVNELIKSLYKENFFVLGSHGWEWDLQKLVDMNVTDKVADFMIQRIKKYPKATLHSLQYAACIGNSFETHILEIVQESSSKQIIDALKPAIKDGIILNTENVYSVKNKLKNDENINRSRYEFLHDRVQQAAYSLLDDSAKQQSHLTQLANSGHSTKKIKS